jgi:hypothetical protein
VGFRVTIVVAVAAPDGIVLAADSRSTLFEDQHHRIASDGAVKLFTIGDRVGVATFGTSFIDHQTIAGVMDEFVSSLQKPKDLGVGSRVRKALSPPENYEVSYVAQRLAKFFDQRLQEAKDVFEEDEIALGFLVAGYDADGIGRIIEILLPNASDSEMATTATRGFVHRGQSDVADRLLFGVDAVLLADLGVEVPDEIDLALKRLAYKVMHPLSMQDAIDFATFIVRTTIDMQRFSDGTGAMPNSIPGCGGPVRVLAVNRQQTSWIADPALTVVARAGLAEGTHS